MPDKPSELSTSIDNFESSIAKVLRSIENFHGEVGDREAGRWLAVARTHLETGLMFARKAVDRPKDGLGRKNPSEES